MFDFSGAGKVFTKEDKSITARWSFWKGAGGSRGLHIQNGNSFLLRVQDDLTGLVTFRATIQEALA
jgi:hypothetical protein|tara:strand:+ start:878 stop:1075 length:198 start_codon:yes stop_codon:yes gene_type:complete